MAKGYKIKRNRRIQRYRSPVSIALRVSISVALVFGLAFIGWSAYGPVSDYLAGTLAASLQQSSSSNTVSADEISPPTPAPTTPEAPATLISTDLCAVYLPTPLLTNIATLDQQLTELAGRGFNAVMFDLKNSAGRVLYRSSVPSAAAGQVEDAFDLAALCKKLDEHGFTAVGRLHAFRDPVAADVHRSMSVKYMNTQSLWLDNSANQGGKPWLNPYSSEAQSYILDLTTEAAQMGVQQIVLDSVTLPVAFMLEYASFGPSAVGVSVQQTLSTFVAEAETRAENLNSQVSLYISGVAALGTQNTYYGGNPLEIAGKNILLGVMPSQFGDGYSCPLPFPSGSDTGSFNLETPLLSPFATVDALYSAVSSALSGKKVTALLQGSTATGAFKNNKAYTAEDINEQIRALTKNDIQNYILFSPDGSYPQQQS